MAVFEESKRIRLKSMPPKHPLVAMVLNNIACCEFLLKNNIASLEAFQEACDIQHDALGSTARADLDLLHAAITLCNFGYMKLGLKEYEEAQAVFEEALLVRHDLCYCGYCSFTCLTLFVCCFVVIVDSAICSRR
jgi:tetratricopeptide (TPR) repeat protein